MTPERLAHDAWAALLRRLGRPPRVAVEHPRVLERVRIQVAGRLDLPDVLGPAVHGAAPDLSFSWPERHAYRLKDAWIAGADSAVYLDRRTVFGACHSLPGLKLRRPLPLLARRLGGPAFLLAGRCPENRAHLLVDHLPRLSAAAALLRERGVSRLVAPAGLLAEAGAYAGAVLGPARLVPSGPGTIACPELWVAPLLSAGDGELLPGLPALRALAAAVAAPAGGPEVPVVFVSRRDAPDRRLVNEEEVVAAFAAAFGRVETVVFSGLGLEEKVARLARGAVVAGAHGQAFRMLLHVPGRVFVQVHQEEREATLAWNPWDRAFRAFAAMNGGCGVTLYSGTGLDAGRNFAFPVDRLRDGLARIRAALPGLPPAASLRLLRGD